MTRDYALISSSFRYSLSVIPYFLVSSSWVLFRWFLLIRMCLRGVTVLISLGRSNGVWRRGPMNAGSVVGGS